MITKAEQKRFRAIGHGLKPVVTIAGNGLSEAVVDELVHRLNDHELIKIRINADDRKVRKSTIIELSRLSGSLIVQTIGSVALLYKAATKPNPKLSNVLRSNIL